MTAQPQRQYSVAAPAQKDRHGKYRKGDGVADFKDEISPQLVKALAGSLAAAWPDFPEEGFVAQAGSGLEPLALLARVGHVAAALRQALPDAFPTAAAVVHRALEAPDVTGWMTLPLGYYVADHGLAQPDVALPLLAALSPRFSSEGPIRPFIELHPEVTFGYLRRWATDPDPHLRRLVTEGTRPRLPWAPHLRGFIADPGPTLEFLDLLHDDESEYVRRSVANHLNDIAKDHPDLAVRTARRWQSTGTPGSAWVIRHGLRTLVKQGHPQALALLGFDRPDGVSVTGLTVSPEELPIGAATLLSFTVATTSSARLVIDYAVHHAGATGTRRPKVFKLTTRTVDPGRPQTITRRHPFRESSVRRLYPGPHRIDLQVNGHTLASTSVTLTADGPAGGLAAQATSIERLASPTQ